MDTFFVNIFKILIYFKIKIILKYDMALNINNSMDRSAGDFFYQNGVLFPSYYQNCVVFK
jgi:hypothetical protein